MVPLQDPEVIELIGTDARSFAQAQFCNDVDNLAPGTCQLNAWLNPQGRIRALFHLYCVQYDHYVLLLRGGLAIDIVRALSPFVFRSKLRILTEKNWQLRGQSDVSERQDAILAATSIQISLPGSARHMHLLSACGDRPNPVSAEHDRAWIHTDIHEGLPTLPATALEQFLPSWLDLERLGAISYRKGCYPGQEIVARMHFRGVGAPRQLAMIRYCATDLPTDDVLRDPLGASFAWLLNRISNADHSVDALAVLSVEAACAGSSLCDSAGHEVKIVPTQWRHGCG